MNNFEIDEGNSICIDFNVGDKDFKMIAIYRSPSLNIGRFITSLDNQLQSLKLINNIIILGDINIDILGNNNLVNEYLSMM